MQLLAFNLGQKLPTHPKKKKKKKKKKDKRSNIQYPPYYDHSLNTSSNPLKMRTFKFQNLLFYFIYKQHSISLAAKGIESTSNMSLSQDFFFF